MQSVPNRSPGSTLTGTVNVNDCPSTASETARPKPSDQTCWDANAVAAKMTCAVKCFFIPVDVTDNPDRLYHDCLQKLSLGRPARMMRTLDIWFNAQFVNISGFAGFRIPLQGRHDAQ